MNTGNKENGKSAPHWVMLFFTPFFIFILILAAYMLMGPTDQGVIGPIKILYTGDVGGALDPCG
ncbi:hypothetical protein EP232_03900 [bacterium]|nr:MAG: hypothetical protein EP232_03900 [bacterium]